LQAKGVSGIGNLKDKKLFQNSFFISVNPKLIKYVVENMFQKYPERNNS